MRRTFYYTRIYEFTTFHKRKDVKYETHTKISCNFACLDTYGKL